MNRLMTLVVMILLNCSLMLGQNLVVDGIVVDATTKKSLAFVNVVIPHQNKGTNTDIDGKYSLNTTDPIDSILFSYLGYDSKIYHLSNEEKGKRHIVVNISLKPKNFTLKELVFNAGENPAHRIINKVIENRDQNNPDKLHSYTYTTYNKFVFTANPDSVDKAMKVSDESESKGLKIITAKDSLKRDSARKEAHDFVENTNFFLVESVTEKKFLYPDNAKETVIASKVSGFENPGFSLIASEMQGFSFYNDYFVLLERNYLNPLSKGSTHKYFFNIEDTTYIGKDTVYIISFKPLPKKNFEGMKGLLYINTNGYALQNVITEPAEVKRGNQLTMKIQQHYQYMENKHWFPTQLNTDLTLKKAINGYADLYGIGRTYIKEIKFDTALKRGQFDDIALDYMTGMKVQNDSFWNRYRQDTLTLKERNTYHVIDSIGKADKLDQKLKLFIALSNNKIPYYFIDFNLDKFLNENDFEGIRLGLGIHTNEKFSKRLNIGGYYAYGFKNHKNNYGFDGNLLLFKRKDIRIGGSFAHDVNESGAQTFYHDQKSFFNDEFRKFLVHKMDAIEDRKAFISGNFITYVNAELYIRQNTTETTDNYLYTDENHHAAYQFHFTEAGIGLRYAYKEKYVKAFEQKLSNGTKYPVLFLNVSHGFNNRFGGQYSYTKFDLQVEKSFRIRNMGRSSFVINAGLANGALPYPILYNGKGSNASLYSLYHTSFYSMNSFQAMGMNEFLSDRFLAVFYHHNFGHLLFKAKNFEPSISIVSNAGVGTLLHPEMHQGLDAKTMNRGYFESGLLLNNLYKIAFTRIGLGAFYRYGAYSSPQAKDNIYLKISWMLGL